MSRLRQVGKRVLSNQTAGRIAAKVTRHQIETYEKRLPRLWRLYARIPGAASSAWGDKGEQAGILSSYYRFLARHVPTLPYQPLISVVVPVHNTSLDYLEEMLASVKLQTYPKWQLCLCDDASTKTGVWEALTAFERGNQDRVRLTRLATNSGIAVASNAAIKISDGDYVALLDHDDRLYPNALAEMVRAMNLEMSSGSDLPAILYSDERVIGENGELLNDPFFKPDWSPLLHLSVNYTTHLTLYSRSLLVEVGGFREGFDGSQDHDLMLRASERTSAIVHVPHVLYQWRAHAGSTAKDLDAKPHAAAAGVRAVQEACTRRGTPAEVSFEVETGHYRTKFQVEQPPLVSVVIPTHNAPDLLRSCLTSIRDKTTYPNYEVILVDNATSDPVALKYLQTVGIDAGVTVVRDEGYFNFARLCNAGVRHAAGDMIVLLNNDTTVQTDGWLEAMVGLAQQPSVGAVGCKLLYPDGSIQHAGVVGLADVIAGHAAKGRNADDRGYIHMASTVHEVLAVTAACLMVRRELFRSVGGLDEQWVPNAYGDVDFCLRLRGAGYRNVFTPYAVLTHHESPTRGLNIENFERIYMRQRWGEELLNDPYLNPNLGRNESYAIDRRFVLPEMPSSFFARMLARQDS